eukprot:3992926-Prymnesium_polylepis.1
MPVAIRAGRAALDRTRPALALRGLPRLADVGRDLAGALARLSWAQAATNRQGLQNGDAKGGRIRVWHRWAIETSTERVWCGAVGGRPPGTQSGPSGGKVDVWTCCGDVGSYICLRISSFTFDSSHRTCDRDAVLHTTKV